MRLCRVMGVCGVVAVVCVCARARYIYVGDVCHKHVCDESVVLLCMQHILVALPVLAALPPIPLSLSVFMYVCMYVCMYLCVPFFVLWFLAIHVMEHQNVNSILGLTHLLQ